MLQDECWEVTVILRIDKRRLTLEVRPFLAQ